MMEVMRVNSSITRKWKVYTIGGFFCFFAVALFVTSNYQRSVDEISVTATILSSSSSSTSTTHTTTTTTTTSKSESESSAAAMTNSSSSSTSVILTVNQTAVDSNTNTVDLRSTNSSTDLVKPPAEANSSSTTYYSSTSNNLTTTEVPPVAALPTSAPPPASPTAASTASKNRDAEVVTAAGEGSGKKTSSPSLSSSSSTCNIYEGKWVYKPTKRPTYSADNCPFLAGQVSCQGNGRPDSDYERWIWEPTDCHIPLFNAKYMLKKMRGKRVIFVGDSLNRNQWLSIACLIYTSIPRSRSYFKITEMYKVIKAKDYDFTLEFYWIPFLVELDYNRRILKLDTLDKSSKQWRGADVMVFNSGHWWTHGRNMRVWDVAEYKGQTITEISKELAYERALTTWLTWLNKNVDQKKTTVFFRSISPEHKGKQLCYNVTNPILDESFINKYPHSMTEVVERTIINNNNRVLFPVRYLNITKLSGYRQDAHPSLYGKKEASWRAVLAEEHDINKVAKEIADCSHWCLPGVPDTWNRLIYVSLFFSHLNGTL